jgi:hypothetical protein
MDLLPRKRTAILPVGAAAHRRAAVRAAALAAGLVGGLAPARAGAQTGGAPAAAPATRASVVTLRGTIVDSLARAPLAGATVQAARADARTIVHTTHTDSLGRFHFDTLVPGRYLLGFFDARFDALGVEAVPRVVDLSAGVGGEVVLAVPGPTTVRAAVCPPLARGDSAGAVAGVVRDADTDAPVAGASVTVSWTEMTVSRRGVRQHRRDVPVTARADGAFLNCGVPTDVPFEASATAPGRASGLVEVSAPARGLVVQNFALGPAATPVASAVAAPAGATAGGAATPVAPAAAPAVRSGGRRAGAHRRAATHDGAGPPRGRVVARDGRPIGGARVRVWDAAAEDTTSADGRFVLANLPVGTRTVEARRVGFGPGRVAVDLSAARVATARVVMSAAVPELERVVVRGRARDRTVAMTGFLERKRTGLGRYMTRADIEQTRALDMTAALRAAQSPSLQFIPRTPPAPACGRRAASAATCCAAATAACRPLFIDGVPVTNGANELNELVRPESVEAIEVYAGPGSVPAQFNQRGNGCGAVLVWTRVSDGGAPAPLTARDAPARGWTARRPSGIGPA